MLWCYRARLTMSRLRAAFFMRGRSRAVNRDQMARIALRYDTAMSRAMLRALGVPVPHRARPGAIVRADRYEGVAECMAQKVGVRP